MRATLECERRFGENDTEAINGTAIKLTNRQLMATLLDVRTKDCLHITHTQRKNAVELLEKLYVEFSEQSHDYQKRALEMKLAQLKDTKSCVTPSQPPRKKSKIAAEKVTQLLQSATAGFCCDGTTAFTDSDASSDQDIAAEATAPVPTLEERQFVYRENFKKYFKKWRTLALDWKQLFPKESLSWANAAGPDKVADLMQLPIGRVYKNIIAVGNGEDPIYGFLPLMAGCSKGQIGALNAESYAERVLSVANLIVTDGNTLLHDDMIEKLVLLRINRDFIEYMRVTYKYVSKDHALFKHKQQFGITVVKN